jgi:pimeloyl-ACP methyl ester carboxylesterase
MELPAYHPFRSEQAKEEYLALYDLRAKRWPVASEPRMVETSYGQTFVRISGAAGAEPLVLLPGAGVNSLMWEPNIEALSARFRTHAVDDISGFGRSVCTRPIKSSGDFVSWLEELFTALGLGDRIHLMGLSYGGWLTSQYALRFPQRLTKTVWLAPAATVLPLRLQFYIRMVLSGLHRRLVASMLNWVFEDSLRKDESSRRMVAEAIGDMQTAMRCFAPKRGGAFPTVLTDQDLRSLQVPTLFLVGEHEKIYSAQKAVRRLNTVAPRIKTAIIPQAGHDLTVVQPELVNRKLLEFLKYSCL